MKKERVRLEYTANRSRFPSKIGELYEAGCLKHVGVAPS